MGNIGDGLIPVAYALAVAVPVATLFVWWFYRNDKSGY